MWFDFFNRYTYNTINWDAVVANAYSSGKLWLAHKIPTQTQSSLCRLEEAVERRELSGNCSISVSHILYWQTDRQTADPRDRPHLARLPCWALHWTWTENFCTAFFSVNSVNNQNIQWAFVEWQMSDKSEFLVKCSSHKWLSINFSQQRVLSRCPVPVQSKDLGFHFSPGLWNTWRAR